MDCIQVDIGKMGKREVFLFLLLRANLFLSNVSVLNTYSIPGQEISSATEIIKSERSEDLLKRILGIDNALNSRSWWGSEDDVHFWLYTRKNLEDYQVITTNDSASLENSNFDFADTVKIVVHGWVSSGNSVTPEEIKDAYLNRANFNVIIVDWRKIAYSEYIYASSYVSMVGKLLTDFLKFLVQEGVSTNDVHLIGHSLGAHVVGIAGYYFSGRTPIAAITGLDPAKPLFEWASDNERLDKIDARHVEVIHTCGGWLGLADPLGHLDFYPNGGSSQPGCWPDIAGFCAHDRVVTYFAESITSNVPFTSMECESYEELNSKGYCYGPDRELLNMSGTELNYGKTGIFYLQTHSERPFAISNPEDWHI